MSAYIQSVTSEICIGLFDPLTFNTKTLESVELSPLFADDRKVYTAKLKANIARVLVVW